MRKQYFVLLLVGLIAAAAVVLTGCPPQTYEWYFENYTTKTITVISQDLSPSRLDVPATNIASDEVPVITATSTKSNPEIGYTLAGYDATVTRNNVDCEINGPIIIFRFKDDSILTKVKKGEILE
jgi:hypothetical protein